MKTAAFRIIGYLSILAFAVFFVRLNIPFVSAQTDGFPATIPAASGTVAVASLCSGMANGTATSQTGLIDDTSLTTGNTLSKCRAGVVTGPFMPVTQYYFDLVPSLFGTNTAVGGVYLVPTGQTIKSIITRIAGSPICTTAPTVVILDLGTSPTTAYASATVLTSLSTSTSNGVFNNSGLSIPVTAGHYVGYGLSAGTCVTPPTITTTISAA